MKIRNVRVPQFPAGQVPLIEGLRYEENETFLAGALLFLNTDGLVQECPSNNPQDIDYIAGTATNTSYGKQAANSPEIETNVENTISGFQINPRTNRFAAYYVDASDRMINPVRTDIGKSLGMRKVPGIGWCVDSSIIANPTVKITNVDPVNKMVYFRFTVFAAPSVPTTLEIFPSTFTIGNQGVPFSIVITPSSFTIAPDVNPT